jgi:hypothetical protein
MPIPKEQLPIARARYKRVIAKLEPQLVIALCYRLWTALPSGGREGQPILNYATWHYDDEHPDYDVLFLPHPASPAWNFEKTSEALEIAFSPRFSSRLDH